MRRSAPGNVLGEALLVALALASGCAPPCGGVPPPATGGSEASRAVVDDAMAAFAATVVPAARCVASVAVVRAIPSHEPGFVDVGAYDWGTGHVRIVDAAPSAMAGVVAHESCHALDDGLGLSQPHGSPFRPPGTSRRAAAEDLAAWCELGLESLDFLRAATAACGPSDDEARMDAVLSGAAAPIAWAPSDLTVTPAGSWTPPAGETVDLPSNVWWSPQGDVALVWVRDAAGRSVTRAIEVGPAGDGTLPSPTEVDDAVSAWMPPDWSTRSGALLPDGSLAVATRPRPDGAPVWGLFGSRGGALRAGPCLPSDGGQYALIPAFDGAWLLHLEPGEVTWSRVSTR